MSKRFFKMQLPLILVAGTLTVTMIAWKEDQFAQTKISTADTVPKKERKVWDIDEALKELDKAQIELERSIKEMPVPSFDKEKMHVEIEKALKELDSEKIQRQVDEAMKEIDAQKIKVQADAALAKVDMEKLKIGLEQLKKIEFQKIEVELEKIKPQVEAELKKAKVEIEKAKLELKEYKAFEDGLEKDGLIDKNEEYTIEHKDGQLIINGKTQPEAVYNKYRKFLEKHKKFKLGKNDDDFHLDVE